MQIRPVLLGLSLLLAAGCGGGSNSDPAEGGQGGWRIPAGVYGTVAPGENGGDLGGIELSLDRGSESETVDFIRCERGCNRPETRPLRRGLNGIAFTIDDGGRTVDAIVNPAGPDAVELNVDRGQGLETHRLPRIQREVGLAAARGKADGAAPPSVHDRLLAPSSPRPAPSPTP